ncbi:MAG: SH3 domain-containing C40 family peptidase [Bacillota bacterium]|nr:SH3 domain-containing C40 family peptidase [Bacillota bacterium]
MRRQHVFYLIIALFIFISLAVLPTGAASLKSGTITGNGVRLRALPSLNGEVLSHLYKGDTVEIISQDDSWDKVSASGKTGYVSTSYIKASDAPSKSRGEQVVDYAKKYLGVKYIYGGTTPKGFDCSGLVYYVYKQFGVSLPTGAKSQYASSSLKKIDKSELQPGDLVFFSAPGKSSIQHVGIYVGGGKFIHSNNPRGSVRITGMTSGYYKTYYYGAKRVIS